MVNAAQALRIATTAAGQKFPPDRCPGRPVRVSARESSNELRRQVAHPPDVTRIAARPTAGLGAALRRVAQAERYPGAAQTVRVLGFEINKLNPSIDRANVRAALGRDDPPGQGRTLPVLRPRWRLAYRRGVCPWRVMHSG